MLYETLINSIAASVKSAINEASIYDMETANGRINGKSKASSDRDRNIVYKLKELGIKALLISSGCRQTSLNSTNDENKLIQGEYFSEYQTIKVKNPVKNELAAGEYFIYVKSAQSQYSNCILSEKRDKFGKTIWENDKVKYIAFVFTEDRDYYYYYIVDKKILYKEYQKLVDMFVTKNGTKRMLNKSTGNTIMYNKATGYNITYCDNFIMKNACINFAERHY